ncbi:MAG: NAD-dependent epimerase/dehydratase family protein [Candidatus Zixiibacteriota bacterium]
MNILVIGGTRFVGRHIVEKALANGHKVTLFNRGQTDPVVFPRVEKLVGDRDGDIQELEGRTWDCVIDTCGYVPRIVKQSVDLLKNSINLYVFISTVSVYEEKGMLILPEEARLKTIEDETVEEINEDTYGALKVLCEHEVLAAYPNRALIIRPGLIIGPHDYTDRFTYWPRRMTQDGPMLVPDLANQPVQFIDARDLAAFLINLIEKNRTGIFNATGPDDKLHLGDFFEQCRDICGGKAEFVMVSDKFLQKRDDIKPFRDIPLWLSAKNEPYGDMRVDISRAIDAGLTFTSLKKTILDTLAWDETRPEEEKYMCGLKPEREREILDAWFEERAGE